MLTDGAALNRWRLILGKNADQQIGLSDGQLVRMDEAPDFLYGREAGADVKGERDPQGGHGASQLTVARWLSEVRCLFPRETAEILQRHALDRYQLTELLANREVLEKMEPNRAPPGNHSESETPDEGARSGCCPLCRETGGRPADRADEKRRTALSAGKAGPQQPEQRTLSAQSGHPAHHSGKSAPLRPGCPPSDAGEGLLQRPHQTLPPVAGHSGCG